MMEPDSDKIRAVAWIEVFPWLRIARAFRLAISVRALLMGAVAVLFTLAGWAFLTWLFAADINNAGRPDVGIANDGNVHSWTALVDNAVPDRPALLDNAVTVPSPRTSPLWDNPMFYTWRTLTQPAISGISDTAQPPRAVALILLSGLWAAAVWALFGAAICRIAAVQLAADEQVGWGPSLRFAGRKWVSYFAAPLMPVGGVIFFAVPVIVLGLIMRPGGFGLLLGGIFWPLALVAGFIMAILLLGVLFGWPLMWGAISTEGSDSFDALSRSYAYLFQRPLHYLFYTLVAALIGWLGWLFVREFASGVIWMTTWAAGWTSGGDVAQPSGMEFAGYWLKDLFSRLREAVGRGLLVQLLLVRLGRHLSAAPPRRRRHRDGRGLPRRRRRRGAVRPARDQQGFGRGPGSRRRRRGLAPGRFAPGPRVARRTAAAISHGRNVRETYR